MIRFIAMGVVGYLAITGQLAEALPAIDGYADFLAAGLIAVLAAPTLHRLFH